MCSRLILCSCDRTKSRWPPGENRQSVDSGNILFIRDRDILVSHEMEVPGPLLAITACLPVAPGARLKFAARCPESNRQPFRVRLCPRVCNGQSQNASDRFSPGRAKSDRRSLLTCSERFRTSARQAAARAKSTHTSCSLSACCLRGRITNSPVSPCVRAGRLPHSHQYQLSSRVFRVRSLLPFSPCHTWPVSADS